MEMLQQHLRTAQDWLMKDVRIDVLSTFDARHMNPKETTALILISGKREQLTFSGPRPTAAGSIKAIDPTDQQLSKRPQPTCRCSYPDMRNLLVLVAMAWLLLEVVLQIVARPFLYAYFYPSGAPLHKKGQREAAATVTGGVERLVGTVFNFMQVRYASGQLYDLYIFV
jgi:hypothetical protein